MKTFSCRCGNRLFFHNTQCLNCKSPVGFSPIARRLVPLDEAVSEDGRPLAQCVNYGRGMCNWLVADTSDSEFCLACRLNVEVASTEGHEELLRNVEIAKRRLVFTLLALGLPVVPKTEHTDGVGFALRRSAPDTPVTIGHSDGLITLDLNEADPAKREEVRASLGEDYRTVLGHFRHEVGHYYWPLIFDDEARKEQFREVFGDERADYAAALKEHYANPKSGAGMTHISSYATAHPWEDWAETWAHYLHIVDSWETAVAFGLRTASADATAEDPERFEAFLNRWSELMIALNSMNRSMGHDDAYPFQLAPEVRTKLAYVQRTVRECAPRLHERFSAPAVPNGPEEPQRPQPAKKPQTGGPAEANEGTDPALAATGEQWVAASSASAG